MNKEIDESEFALFMRKFSGWEEITSRDVFSAWKYGPDTNCIMLLPYSQDVYHVWGHGFFHQIDLSISEEKAKIFVMALSAGLLSQRR